LQVLSHRLLLAQEKPSAPPQSTNRLLAGWKKRFSYRAVIVLELRRVSSAPATALSMPVLCVPGLNEKWQEKVFILFMCEGKIRTEGV
jgi:hypothetical protein